MEKTLFNPENRVSWLEITPSLQELFKMLQAEIEYESIRAKNAEYRLNMRIDRVWGDISLDDDEHTIRDIWDVFHKMQDIYDHAEDGQMLRVDKYFDKHAPFIKADDEFHYMGVVDTEEDVRKFMYGLYNMKQVAMYWQRIWLDAYSNIQMDDRDKSEGKRVANEFYYNEKTGLLGNENNAKSLIGLLTTKKIAKRVVNYKGDVTLTPEYTLEVEFDGSEIENISPFGNTGDYNDKDEWGVIIAAFQDDNGLWHDLSVVRRCNNPKSKFGNKVVQLCLDRFNPNNYESIKNQTSLSTDSDFKKYWDNLYFYRKDHAKYYPYNQEYDIKENKFEDVSITNYASLNCIIELGSGSSSNYNEIWKDGKCRIKVTKSVGSVSIQITPLVTPDHEFEEEDYSTTINYFLPNTRPSRLTEEQYEVLKTLLNKPCYIGLELFANYGSFKIISGDLYNTQYILNTSNSYVYEHDKTSDGWNYVGLIEEVLPPKILIYDIINCNLWWYPARGEALVKILNDTNGTNYKEATDEMLDITRALQKMTDRAEDGEVIKVDKDRKENWHKELPFLISDSELNFIGVVNSKEDKEAFKYGMFNMKHVSKYWKRIWLDAYTNIQNDSRYESEGQKASNEFFYDEKSKTLMNENNTKSIIGLLSDRPIYKKYIDRNKSAKVTIKPEYTLEVEFDGYCINDIKPYAQNTIKKFDKDIVDLDNEWGIIIAAFQDENHVWHDLTVVRRGNINSGLWTDRQFELVFDRFNPNNYSTKLTFNNSFKGYLEWLEKNYKERYENYLKDSNSFIMDYSKNGKIIASKSLANSEWSKGKCRIKVIKDKDSFMINTTNLRDQYYTFTSSDYVNTNTIVFTRPTKIPTGFTNEEYKNLLYMFDNPCYVGLELFSNFGAFRIVNGDIYDTKYLVDIGTNNVYKKTEFKGWDDESIKTFKTYFGFDPSNIEEIMIGNDYIIPETEKYKEYKVVFEKYKKNETEKNPYISFYRHFGFDVRNYPEILGIMYV